jgi:dTDP-4-dehydrorhamnose 3,5-epimerase
MMEVIPTAISGCYELIPYVKTDKRGSFVKTFHREVFKNKSLEFESAEEYFTWSNKNVIRGMHFQTPPHAHIKIVTCLCGEVTDVIVDLRTQSPTYKTSAEFNLSEHNAKMIYIPQGLAHGFTATTEQALMFYKVSSTYAPENDEGIRWDTIGYEWKVHNPIISDRDLKFPPLENYSSPF